MTINRANQVWALGATYIPLAKGFANLTAGVDWATRKVLAAKVVITLKACHAVDVLEQAFKHYGGPDIGNTDKGSLYRQGVCRCGEKPRLSQSLVWDGRVWRDNGFVERLWRFVKYERVCLHAHDSVGQARA